MKYDKEFDVWVIPCPTECYGSVIGITRYAAEQIGEISYINFAVKAGDRVERGDVLAHIESPKTCAEVKAPFTGTVVAVLDDFIDEKCQRMNNDAERVVMLSVRPNDIADLDKMVSKEEYLEAKKK